MTKNLFFNFTILPSVCLYLHTHQPWRLKKYTIFDIGRERNYFDDHKNTEVLKRIVRKCYLPTNEILLNLIKDTGGRFKVSFSITGVVLEQFEQYAPEVIESFQKLVDTGNVEIVSETYYHSLAFMYSPEEFKKQVKMHYKKVQDIFGYKPKVFRNTELMYSNDVAKAVESMGYEAILAEGVDRILNWRSPNFVYRPRGTSRIKLLLKNYRLSDDIAFRFSSKEWSSWPLTAEKFAGWVNQVNGNGTNINLFMDYETFGEHQWPETGIFDFLKAMPWKILDNPDNNFLTPTEVARRYDPVGELDYKEITSWADTERDLSAWVGNKMQQSAIRELYELEKAIYASLNEKLIDDWRRLQISDHFYYMCTKWFSDGDVHKYFNPYDSPYDAFINFMNIVKDMKLRLQPAPVPIEAQNTLPDPRIRDYALSLGENVA